MNWLNQIILDGYRQTLEQVANSLKGAIVFSGLWLPDKRLAVFVNNVFIGTISHKFHFEKGQYPYEHYTGAWQVSIQFEPIADYWALTKLIS